MTRRATRDLINPAQPYARTLFEQLARPFIMPAAGDRAEGLRLIFDIEANGLLDTATEVWCVVIADVDIDRVWEYGPNKISAALEHLARADVLIGHSIQSYDLPVLRKLHGWAPRPERRIVDTLIAARSILPHLAKIDGEVAARAKDEAFGKIRGHYGLEDFGVRLGIAKVGADIDDWSKWTPEVQARCVGDVAICKRLWHFLRPDGYSREALELEHRVAAICDRIAADGVPFDREAAERLAAQWEVRRAELEAQLRQQLPEIKNPNSRRQIGAMLESRGWKPAERTEKTQRPVIDDKLLESLPALYPEFAGIAEHDLLRRRLAQLKGSAKAWLSHVGSDGRIHGGLIHIGTPHSRAKHLEPNLAQVPNAKKGSAYAAECRALFRHPGDWAFVYADQANLQDRSFAEYLVEFDGGAYAETFLDGIDRHWQTAIALGLIAEGAKRDKESAVHTAAREAAKTILYAFLFGAGAKRIGEILVDTVRAIRHLDPTYTVCSTDGKTTLNRFMAATPGLAQLRASLKAEHRRHGWVEGLDGRRVPTDADYKALNRIVTASEAVLCKQWLAAVYHELHARFRYGPDGDAYVCLWIHDELVVCCRREIAEQVSEILVRHAKTAGKPYDFRVPLEAEVTIARDWAGTQPDDAAPGSSLSTSPSDDTATGDEVDADARNSPTISTETLSEELVETTAEASPWSTPGMAEMPPRPELEEIIAGLPPEARELVRSPKTNGSGAWHADNGRYNRSGASTSLFHCPFHADNRPSLKIYNAEDDPHYHCFGCNAHGPLSDLPEDLIAAASPGSAASKEADDAETRACAHQLWDEAGPIGDTLAERYLFEVRGIDLEALPPDIDGTLRFHPSCPFNGGDRKPCLIALFRDVETDEPAGIHRIALGRDVFAGAKVERQMLGRWPRPRVIKLWPLKGDRLFLGEGIETTLAASTWLTYHGVKLQPAWAAGTCGNITKFPILAGIEELLLLVDRDAAGEDAAKACAEDWRAAGRRVRRLRPKDSGINDFNDLVRAKLRVAL
jgi:DNA polymerase-1